MSTLAQRSFLAGLAPLCRPLPPLAEVDEVYRRERTRCIANCRAELAAKLGDEVAQLGAVIAEGFWEIAYEQVRAELACGEGAGR